MASWNSPHKKARNFQIGDAVRRKHSRGYPGEKGEVIATRQGESGQAEYQVKWTMINFPMWEESTDLMPWGK